jgi:hypothetical protein
MIITAFMVTCFVLTMTFTISVLKLADLRLGYQPLVGILFIIQLVAIILIPIFALSIM